MKYLLWVTVSGMTIALLSVTCDFSTIRQRVVRNVRHETLTLGPGATLDNHYSLHPKDTGYVWFWESSRRPVDFIVQDSAGYFSAPHNPSQAVFAVLDIASDTTEFAVTGDTALYFEFLNPDTMTRNIWFHLDRIYWEKANP